MGQKSKADQLGLKELIIEKWEGGKKTIVWVTEDLNEHLKQNGLKITISREAIRRVVRSHEDEIADARRALEISKEIAGVFKDYSGTEQSEAMLMCISNLIAKDLRTYESFVFEDPVKMVDAAAKVTMAQAKLAQFRTQAVKALDKAKSQLKAELQKVIQHDPDLLGRLCVIVDNAKVK